MDPSTEMLLPESRLPAMKAPLAWDRPCPSADNGIRVPALLDPNSTDRNFNTIGQNAQLYFVTARRENCMTTDKRDLKRVPIQFSP